MSSPSQADRAVEAMSGVGLASSHGVGGKIVREEVEHMILREPA